MGRFVEPSKQLRWAIFSVSVRPEVKERLDAAARAAGKSSAAWGREILEAALVEAETSTA